MRPLFLPWAHPRALQVVPIIDIPGFGTAAAEKVCLDMKIQSQVGGQRMLLTDGRQQGICIMAAVGMLSQLAHLPLPLSVSPGAMLRPGCCVCF